MGPERIWLLDHGDVSCTWCEDADPDGEHHDSIGYVRADVSDGLYVALEGALECIEAFGIDNGGIPSFRAALARAQGPSQ